MHQLVVQPGGVGVGAGGIGPGTVDAVEGRVGQLRASLERSSASGLRLTIWELGLEV